MVVSGDLSSTQGSFAFQLRVDNGSIWNRFGVDLGAWEGLGRVLGGSWGVLARGVLNFNCGPSGSLLDVGVA